VNTTKGQAALLVLIFGEKAASERFYFSLKAGLNYSSITNYEEGNNATGVHFGLINNIKLNDRLFFTPEFVPLTKKGIRDVPVLTTGDPNLDTLLVDVSSTSRKLSYIDIPILFKIYVSERFCVTLGPQVSFLTGASDIYESSPLQGSVLTTDLDIKSALKTVDAGFVFDLSYNVSTVRGGKGLSLYARYSRSFVDILKDNAGDPYHNSVFQFGASLPFIEE